MINPLQNIVIEGVRVELLFTPSMYKKSNVKDIDLVVHYPDDTAEVWQIYVKLVYLAYLNALDISRYEGRRFAGRIFTLLDFEVWASGEGKDRFGEISELIVEIKTGKTAAEMVEESEKKAKEKAS